MHQSKKIVYTLGITLISLTISAFYTPLTNAKIGDIGHWRDSVGSQIPGTTFAAFDFDQEIRNDGIYTRPNNSTIELDEAGDYLIITTTHDDDNSNGRYNSQLRITQTVGTGDVFTSYYTGYSRDNSEDDSWTRAVSVIIGASADSQIQIQKRRDTDAPTGGSVADNSDVQVIRLSQTNYGLYTIGGTGNAYGGTTPNTVSIDSVVAESDTGAIEGNTTTDTITLKGDNRKYLIAWSSSFTTGGARTQRIGHLEYDGTDALSTRSYCFGRNTANEYCGLGSMDMIETTAADVDVQTEIFRGTGVAADQGGANSNGNLTTDGNGQMIVLEMPEYLEFISTEDSTGLQDVTSAQTLNFVRDVNANDALSFTKNSNTLINVTNPADIFTWANIWTARNNVGVNARQTTFGSILINGIEQTTGIHGNYSRGNQGSADTFALGFHPGGIFTTTGALFTLGINTTPVTGGEAGGTDRTQPGTVGFFAFNLDTFIAPELEQSAYRFFENNNSTDVGTVLAAQDTSATLTSTDQDFRLRSLISVTQNQLREDEKDLKLQFAERVGTCDVSFTGETYVDVTGATVIAYNNNGTPVDEDSLTGNANDPVNGGTTVIDQSYQEANDFTTSVAAISEDEDGMWDFSLTDNSAPSGTSYCFRIVETDNTLLDTYSVIPEITTFTPPTPGGVSSNLEVWLKVDAGTSTTTDGAALNTWNDQSGNGLNATTGVAPIYRDNTTDNLNFYPVVDFNGTTQYLQNLANGAYSDSYFLVIVPDSDVEGTASQGVPFGWDCLSGTLSSGTCGLNFAGLALGAFTAAFPDEVLTHALGSSVNWRSAQTAIVVYDAGKPMLIGVNENSGGTGSDIYEKGLDVDNASANTYQSLSTADYNIGRAPDATYPFYYDGKIVEVINYSGRVSDPDREKIESYLSLKYGMTLNSGTQDYIASDGTTNMWNTTSAGSYIYNIIGIGRDDDSGLSQIKSKSVNDGAVVTLEGESEGTNTSPSFVDIDDNEYLTISNDGGGNSWMAIGAPATYNILSRDWRVQETGELGTVSIDFDVGDTDFDIPATSSGSTYYFLYDSDNDGDYSDETPSAMTNTSGDIWQITGINFDDGEEFTIATPADSNSIPTDITLSSESINENVADDSTVGTLSTTDSDGGDTHTYSLVSGTGDDDNSLFTISGSTLTINYSPDYELKNSYSIRIETDDSNGGTYQEQFTISIVNLGEAITTTIDFENISDEEEYTVTSGQWNRTTTNTHEGLRKLESDNLGTNGTQSCFEVNHNSTGTGQIDFFYSVSSEAASDFLRFYIDGVEQGTGWSGTIGYTQYTSGDQSPGPHEYKWCYIKDGGGSAGNDNALIDLITFPSTASDVTPPTISTINFATGSLLPGGLHNIIVTYSDADSGIDTTSDSLQLFKWDGISSWGSDIAASNINFTGSTITSTTATYPTLNLAFGKYRYDFSIDDNDGNSSSTGATFYIDIPEFIIGSGSIDIGNVNDVSNTFSSDVDITVRTVGAAFDVTMTNSGAFDYSTETIGGWNGTSGYGFDQSPFTSTISAYSTGATIATQGESIDTDGNKNTYVYTIRFGIITDTDPVAGDYEGNVNFELDLTY